MAENEIKNTTEKHKIEAEIKDNSKNTIKNKKLTIMGLSVWRIMAYFVIYSVVGYIIETIFGIITKGVWESRQSFLYGPFCAIYGLGASIMIMFLRKYSKNYTRLFIGGFIVGSIVEYLVSWIGELLLGVKWWDYSDMPLNINGRICVYFSIFWGALAIFLMTYINKKVDKFLDWCKEKINMKALKTVTILIIIFMAIDCLYTGTALRMFYARIEHSGLIKMQNGQQYLLDYEEIQNKPGVKEFMDKYLNDEKMLKTFPNLKVTDINGDIVLVKDVFPEIQPYYVRLFTPKEIKKIDLEHN